MTTTRRLAVLGGDERQISMSRALAAYGYEVTVWGLGRCEKRLGKAISCKTWQEAIQGAEAIILPLPASADGVRVHCPLQETDVFLRLSVLSDAISGRVLLGGRISEAIRHLAEQKSIRVIDYYDSESLQLKNALPTAEGAISIAMRELPVTVDGIRAGVVGYGRIGSLLAQKLQALGAEVTVYARRREPLILSKLQHHRTGRLLCNPLQIDPPFSEQRVIFNTVPHRIFTREVLESLPKDCVLIDLASAPGGIDHNAARELGVCSVWGTSLPGKCAPESAGIILAQTLTEILEELPSDRLLDDLTDRKDG
ncbi:MAG: dipicolinate synthase [Clostridia bacterium]|nr:dipicolinate synthase [Clostridia bacterium]